MAKAVERERGVLERGRRARVGNRWNAGTELKHKGDVSSGLVVKEPSRTRSNGFKLDKFRFKKDICKTWLTNSCG